MGHSRGKVIEVRLEAGGQMEALIACPAGIIPRAGQYLLATDIDDPEAALGVPLFITEEFRHGFWAAPPIPLSWRPGTSLSLVGPLGHGFDLPGRVQRLALVALGDTVSRLMPMLQLTSYHQPGLTLFTDLSLPALPASLEAYPVSSLIDSLDWPDFMLIDLPLERLSELRQVFSLEVGVGLGFPAQVLITTPMPCAGLARCGACAVPAHRGWKMACEDGPVFDLGMLQW